MCVQTYPRRSKPTRPSSSPSSKQKPSKHLKTSHEESSSSSSSTPIDTVVAPQNNSDNEKRRKSVSFNEVVMVRPLDYMSVSFHEVVMVRPVLHLSEYTDQEIADCWYVLADKQRVKADVMKTLQQYAKDKKANLTSSVNTRGLEKLSDGGRTRERRRISIREILEEQEGQRQEQSVSSQNQEEPSPIIYDMNRFRKIYKPYSRAARHVAHAVGKIDELAATCEDATNANPHTCTRKCKPKNSGTSVSKQSLCVQALQTLG